MNHPESECVNIALRYPEAVRRLRILLAISAVSLFAGLVTPIITLKKFVLVENTFSVLGGVLELLKEGQVFLFVIIAGFSVVLPILKIGVLYRLLGKRAMPANNLDRALRLMHLYGKWSMLDVFVVAVLVVAVKLGVIVSVEMRFGLYAFALSVLLTMYITARVVTLTDSSCATGHS
ncbi:paraquat-inducible protein A [Thiogranum longum]|uniref:Paraquat-inducible protein A n=1 Tax=Thiogranum longum TaxID=1537524 RepID=A0A4R1HAQ4_9GAMM|nr:paraquat-inducible protein A [Thiogranum longum]TCK17671.1 paraquat-inducible protein A [Thiogranum longum]